VRAEPTRSALLVPSREDRLDTLLAVGAPLAARPGRELILARLLADDAELAPAASSLDARRAALEVPSRSAAFTTREPALDVVRLATAYDVDLLLLDAPADLGQNPLPDELVLILERSPAQVALLAGDVDPSRGNGVFVVFGGSTHDWAALEVGAWLASATGAKLWLVGIRSRRGTRDPSRMLADASLAVQRVVGVAGTPLVSGATERALIAAVEPASIVFAGFSPRWRREGIGDARRALVRDALPPVLLVREGPRPGGLAPPQESRTRFSWSIEAS
jgi:hypothetical protein